MHVLFHRTCAVDGSVFTRSDGGTGNASRTSSGRTSMNSPAAFSYSKVLINSV